MFNIHEIYIKQLSQYSQIGKRDFHNYFKLVGLMDILVEYGYQFVNVCAGLSFAAQLQSMDFPDGEPMNLLIRKMSRSIFVSALELCSEFDFRVSKSNCEQAIFMLDNFSELDSMSGKKLPEEISKIAISMLQQLKIESKGEQFLHLDPMHVRFYEENQFHKDVVGQFFEVIYDMQEAGKCFALNRYTSCAFHLMRIAEAGLKSIVDKYNLSVSNPNWGFYIKAIKDHLPSIGNKTERIKLQSVIDRIESLKLVWRNPTMHIEHKYNEDEAKEIFDATKNFMKVLCDSSNESGEMK
jgi:hypothetical protein